jgi:hypothetical protein
MSPFYVNLSSHLAFPAASYVPAIARRNWAGRHKANRQYPGMTQALPVRDD